MKRFFFTLIFLGPLGGCAVYPYGVGGYPSVPGYYAPPVYVAPPVYFGFGLNYRSGGRYGGDHWGHRQY